MGKRRLLVQATDSGLGRLHKNIAQKILNGVALPEAMHGYRKGRSVVTHSKNHVGRSMIARFDIKDCFPSITAQRVRQAFRQLGASPEVSLWLTQLTTWEGRLPLGLATSNALANIVMVPLIERLATLCRKQGLAFSSYADNIEISGGWRVKRLRGLIGRIIRQEGFELNAQKCEFQPYYKRQQVTGIIVNRRLSVSRKKIRRYRALIHKCRVWGPSAAHPDPLWVKKHIEGFIAYLKPINASQAENLQRQFELIKW